MSAPYVDLNELVKDIGGLASYSRATLRHIKADAHRLMAAAEEALAEYEPATSPTPDSADADLITEKEAAAMLGRSVRTLQHQRANNRSPYVDWVVRQPGISGIRYSRKRIAEWLTRSNRTPAMGRK